MCGGVTAYNACKRSGVRPGGWIVIPGAGGGLGHLGVQYAKAMGMRVIAIDGGNEKRDLCKRLGAEHFIDFQETKDTAAEVLKITGLGAHGIIVFASTKAGYESAPGVLRSGGTMVAVGLPPDPTVSGCAQKLVVDMLTVIGRCWSTATSALPEEAEYCRIRRRHTEGRRRVPRLHCARTRQAYHHVGHPQ